MLFFSMRPPLHLDHYQKQQRIIVVDIVLNFSTVYLYKLDSFMHSLSLIDFVVNVYSFHFMLKNFLIASITSLMRHI